MQLIDVTVTRGGSPVLHDVDLRVAAGERVAILGPSGAGKSSLLRAVAGFEHIAHGRILIAERDVTGLPTRERGVAMVAQDAALHGHLDVEENLGFPLTLRGVEPAERARRVAAEARTFSLTKLLRRRPRTLSAGEAHEVALARSLVRRGTVLLLDEPFAKADDGRRAALLHELVQVQEGYGVTCLLATNDQRIAMSAAHRCAVLHEGRLVQVAPPQELYDRPSTVFVAGFLGTPPMNLLTGHIERVAGRAQLQAGPFQIPSVSPRISPLVGTRCTVGIRPTDLRPASGDELIVIEEVVRRRTFLGAGFEVGIGASSDPVEEVVARLGAAEPPVGALLRLTVDPSHVHVFAPDGRALAHGV
ncbi:MAG: ABC transporter ATP-binding protein [Nitriliruptoraceae bacterium]